jgi:serine/threonine protein kinase
MSHPKEISQSYPIDGSAILSQAGTNEIAWKQETVEIQCPPNRVLKLAMESPQGWLDELEKDAEIQGGQDRSDPWTPHTLESHLEVCIACQKRFEKLMHDDETTAWRSLLSEALPHEMMHSEESQISNTGQSLERDWRSRLERWADPLIHYLTNEEGETPEFAVEADDARNTTPILGKLGAYRVLRSLGSGSMGFVYLARDTRLDTLRALKLPRLDWVGSDEMIQRFLREAKMAAQVRSPNVVAILAIEEVQPCPLPILVMEYVDGDALSTHLQQPKQSTASDHSNISMSVNKMIDIARGLAAIHEMGIVHRDLKPSNVMIERLTGMAKITDFGLARLCLQNEDKTSSGVVGTPSYMSPEHILNPDQVDHRSDIFSCGTIFYEMVTLERPFHGVHDLMIQNKITQSDPVPPSNWNDSVSIDLETIILKCIAKEPHSRYQSAVELLRDLERLRDHRPIHARRTTDSQKVVLWCKRHPQQAILGGLLACALLVGLISVTLLWRTAVKRGEALADSIVRLEQQRTRTQQSFDLALKTLDRLVETRRNEAFFSGRPLSSVQHKMLREGQEVLLSRLSERANDKTALERIGMLRQIADTEQSLGNLASAESRYAEAIAQIEREGIDPNTVADYGSILQGQGMIALERGDLEKGKRLLIDSIEQRGRLAEKDPSNRVLIEQLAGTEMEAANMLYRTLDRAGAIELTTQANRRACELLSQSDTPERYLDLAVYSGLQLATLYRHQGDFEQTLRWLERGIDICNRYHEPIEEMVDLHYGEYLLYVIRCQIECEQQRWLEASRTLRHIMALQEREKQVQPDTFDLYSTFMKMKSEKATIYENLVKTEQAANRAGQLETAIELKQERESLERLGL